MTMNSEKIINPKEPAETGSEEKIPWENLGAMIGILVSLIVIYLLGV